MDRSLYKQAISETAVSHKIADLIISKLKKDSETLYAPFQFTLPLMAAIYYDICGKNTPKNISNKIDEIISKSNKIPNTEHISFAALTPTLQEAFDSPLRAIAYFSWEEGSRLFLVRRVFPVYFDFLSYSHCPEGWGALGIMLNKLENSGSDFIDLKYTSVSDFGQQALPFLAEVERLQYSSICTIPIFEDTLLKGMGEFTARYLNGALVFFLSDKAHLPENVLGNSEKLEFKTWILNLNKKINACLDAQTETLKRIQNTSNTAKLQRSPKLAAIWREYSMKPGYKEKISIYEMKIKFNTASNAIINKACSTIIARLSGSEYHAIIEEMSSEQATVLVAGRKKGDDVRPEVLKAIGYACSRDHPLTIEVCALCNSHNDYD